MAGTFSVPARRLRSWRPPVTRWPSSCRGESRGRPTPFGPAELVRRSARADRRRAPARPPGSCRPPGRRRCATSAPCSRASAASSRDRLDDAGLVVGQHDDTSATSASERVASAAGDTTPLASTGRIVDGGAAARRAPAAVLITASCSTALTRMRRRFGVPSQRLDDAAQREVVGLRAAAGEHDVAGLGADERGHLRRAPRRARALARWPKAWMLEALPNYVGERAGQRVDDLGRGRGGGVVIEVDGG